ncbi:MAG: ATP synthase F1 subunit epsilon [Planctomycetales bacterium 4572_13]|nr:MAG: ATP synthase F1 subunit epsilon [Planctomycetales bacterium 4572_13]
MVGLSRGKFRVVLLTPKAKLLEARVGSVVLPAHDGQMGILRNHCPTLAELGFGIMQVRQIADRPDAFYIIEGGFVRISENHVTVLAYAVTTFEGKRSEEVDSMISLAHSVVAGQEYIRSQQESMSRKKAEYIIQMAELAAAQSPNTAGL